MADVLHKGEPMVARIGKMTYEDFELASDVKMLDHHFVDPKGRTVRVKSFYRIEPGQYHERNQRKEGVPEPEKPKGEGKHRHFWEKILCDIQLPLPGSGLDPIEPIGGHIRYHPEGAWYGPFEVFNKRHCPDDRIIVHCHVHTDGSAYQPFQTFTCMKEKMRELYQQRNDPWGPDWYIGFDGELGRAEAIGVRVDDIVEDQAEFRRRYEPAHPDADAEGFVAMPNVDVPEEMVDMLGATRAYQANLTAINLIRDTIQRALELGR